MTITYNVRISLYYKNIRNMVKTLKMLEAFGIKNETVFILGALAVKMR